MLSVIPVVLLPFTAVASPLPSVSGPSVTQAALQQLKVSMGAMRTIRFGELTAQMSGPPTLTCGQEYRHTEPSEGTLGLRFSALRAMGF